MRVGAFLFGLFVALMLFAVDTRVRAPAVQRPTKTMIASIDQDIADRVQGERSIVRFERAPLRFHATNFIWKDPGHPDFVRAKEARGLLDTRALGNIDFIVRGVVITGGEAYVEQNAAGVWNFRRAIDRMMAGRDQSGPGHIFTAYDVAIQDARVAVKSPVRSFGFKHVSAQLTRVAFTGPTLPAPFVEASHATALLVARDSTFPVEAAGGRFVFSEGQMDFNVASVTTGQTRVANLSGSWGENIPGDYGLIANGRVESMRFQDVRFLGPRVPRSGTASFGFEMRPINSLLTQLNLTDSDIKAEGSHITGSVSLLMRDSTFSLNAADARFDPLNLALIEQMMGRPLAYRGTITGTAKGTNGIINFDVNTRLLSAASPDAIVAHVVGSGRFATDDFELRRLETDLTRGLLTGRLLLTSSPTRNGLNVKGRVQIGNGAATIQGLVDLKRRFYDLDGRILAMNLQQALPFNAPPATLTARFSIAGTGFNPDSANARVHLEGRFTGWRSGPHDTVHVAARITNGSLTVDSGAVKLVTMTGSYTGTRYELNFEPITPFAPYIPMIGDDDASGNLRIAGTITGPLRQAHVAGEIRGSNLVVGDWSTTSLDSKYDAQWGAGLPRIVFEANARDLRTPTAGRYETVTANVRLTQPTFALDIRGNRAGEGDGGLEIVADGQFPSAGARELVLQRARMDLGADNWMLVRPAVISWAQPGTDLTVRSFELRKTNGNGMASLEGRLLPLASADFRLETQGVPVGEIQQLLGRTPRIRGALTSKLSFVARAGTPTVTLSFNLDSAVVENVRFAQLRGDAVYGADKLVANANAVVDTAGAIVLHAELPLSMQFADSTRIRMLDSGPVRISLNSDSIALAPLAALAPGMLDRVKGSLSANVLVTGTVEQPTLSGGLAIRNASAFVAPANQTYDSISASISLENREAVIRDFSAKAGGRLRVGGTVTFNDLTKPVLDMQVVLSKFQAVGVDNQDDAQISGEVLLNGPMRSATMTGALRMEEGYFPVPASNNRAVDAQLASFETNLPTSDAPPPTPFFEGLVIDNLRLTAGPNLWFTMVDARAELAGDITIDKHGADMRIVGDLSGERGTYVLRAGPIIRRLEVVQANVRFRGEAELNPALDIIARRRIIAESGREINVDVHVGGTMQAPTLNIASQEAVAIPQSELLSFLLFGQPSFALGGATNPIGDQVISQALLTGGELLSMEAEQSLLDQVGLSLDIFQIRLGGSKLNTVQPSLVVGQEVARNVFLTVEAAVQQLFGNAGTNAFTTYAVRLEWRPHPTTIVRASYEPINPPALRGYILSVPSARLTRDLGYQPTLEIRRRWLW